MTENRDKSITEKKLEELLGIGDSIKKLDDEDTIPPGNSSVNRDDEEKKIKLDERKKYLAEMKGKWEGVKEKPDIEFSKDVYKELIMIDMEFLRIARKEMEMDPSPRYIECAGTLTNSITTTLDSLRDVDIVKVDQGFEREKIDMKKNQGNQGPGTGVVMIGSMSDILSQLKLAQKEQVKTVEATVVLEKDEEIKKD